jgi:hypothetical protein
MNNEYLIEILKEAFFKSCGKNYDEIKDIEWWKSGMCRYDYTFQRKLEKLIKELENE